MSEEEYLKLLDRATVQLSPETSGGERFEIPKPVSSIAGNRTVLTNFKEICDLLKRNRNHLLKYLSGELATSGTIDGDHAIFQGHFNNKDIGQLIERYVKDFVLCLICHRPDTRITRKNRFYFLICEACGASSSIRSI